MVLTDNPLFNVSFLFMRSFPRHFCRNNINVSSCTVNFFKFPCAFQSLILFIIETDRGKVNRKIPGKLIFTGAEGYETQEYLLQIIDNFIKICYDTRRG